MNNVELPKKGDLFITPADGCFLYDTEDNTPRNERRAGLKPQLNIFLGVETHSRRKGSKDTTDYLVYWNSKSNEIDYCCWGHRQVIYYKRDKGREAWLQKDKKGRWFLQTRAGKKTCPVLLELLR